MHIMLAEEIGGWLAAGILVFGAIASTVLALGALYPASKGMRSLALPLIIPAMVFGCWSTCYLGQAYAHSSVQSHEEIIINYVQPWFLMAFPPLAMSILVATLLAWKRRQQNLGTGDAPATSQTLEGCLECHSGGFASGKRTT